VRILLKVLPYLGLVLSAVSVLWGLTHELSTKDEQNKRHLTKAGKYSIAFVLLGLFFSLNTAVLKDITEKQDKAEAREKAAIEERQHTLAEIQRTNSILWNIRRTQYPLSKDIWMMPVLRISVEHPALKPYSGEIEFEVARLIEQHRVFGDREGGQLVPVSEESYLFKRTDGIPKVLRELQLFVWFYEKGSDFTSPEIAPDIRFTYFADVFNGVTEGNTTYRGTMSYSVNNRSFRIAAPRVSPGFTLLSTGRITSVLDLPGATLVIGCVNEETGCSYFSFESLRLEVSSGMELEIPGKSFEHIIVNGRDALVHRFDPDEENFIEKYSYYVRN
jgi:hypothetical protein